MAAVSSTSLAVTLAHAVSFLTAPLVASPAVPASTLTKLQTALEASLANAFVATWDPAAPLRGAGRRVLSFAPRSLPPRPVYNACVAAGIEWADWARALGDNAEFDMLVDPGCVAIRVAGAFGAPPRHAVVWSAELEQQHAMQAEAERLRARQRQLAQEQKQLAFQQRQLEHLALQAPQPQLSAADSKTLAQSIMEAELEDEDALFSLLADELRAPTWLTPVLEQFPNAPSTAVPHVLAQPASEPHALSRAALGHSRSSSRSSNVSSSAFSFLSDESVTSCASLSSVSTRSDSTSSLTSDCSASKSQSRRDRARAARVFVDSSKKEVTPYDGGKTTVLTGGVMLGAPAKPAARNLRSGPRF